MLTSTDYRCLVTVGRCRSPFAAFRFCIIISHTEYGVSHKATNKQLVTFIMKTFWMGWVALISLENNVQAESSSPERWIEACDWLGRNDDRDSEEDVPPPPTAAPIDPCRGSNDLCNEDHKLITSALAYYDGSSCECNLCFGSLTITCESCSGCGAFEGKDACIDSSITTYYLSLPSSKDEDGIGYYQINQAFINVTSSGADSGSWNVVEEKSFDMIFAVEGIDQDYPSLYVWGAETQLSVLKINGVECNLATADDNFCKIYDCRNINSEYYWTCRDFQEIKNNPSHPLHGLKATYLYCPKEV
jgi:hypothetical protein